MESVLLESVVTGYLANHYDYVYVEYVIEDTQKVFYYKNLLGPTKNYLQCEDVIRI